MYVQRLEQDALNNLYWNSSVPKSQNSSRACVQGEMFVWGVSFFNSSKLKQGFNEPNMEQTIYFGLRVPHCPQSRYFILLLQQSVKNIFQFHMTCFLFLNSV